MRRYLLPGVLVLVLAGASAPVVAHDSSGTQRADARNHAASRSASVAKNFEMVGHNALRRRGMNAAPAIYRHWLYVGSRTDASDGHRAGVLVLNIKDPRDPTVVGRIGAPHEAKPSQTSRELRVWPRKKLLMVMNFRCSTLIHSCVDGPDVWNIKFYDLGHGNAADPKLVSTYRPNFKPHEMFLWVDPERPRRALLFTSTPHNSETPNDRTANLVVTDLSRARQGRFPEIVRFSANPRFPNDAHDKRDIALHSMTVRNDGRRTYLAYLGGGFLVLDTSEIAAGRADPRVRLLTAPKNSPDWRNQTVHSAVKVPGRPYVVTTDEIYGDLLDDLALEDHGCPWGKVHIIDIRDEANPKTVGQHSIAQNRRAYCKSAAGEDPANTYFTSYSAHNPTVLPGLAFVTWHSGGLQAFSLADPTDPRRTGVFSPRPLVDVDTEDVALSQGLNKAVMWSFPIIKDGLIYVVDVRNGLYVLRYTGPGHRQVDGIGFYEGNSNLGLAQRLAP